MYDYVHERGGDCLRHWYVDFKRLFSFLLITLLLATPLVSFADYDADHPELLADGDITATAYILIEMSTGNVILERNPDLMMYPASTTKIMTVLLSILASDSLDEIVTVGFNGSKEGVLLLDPDSSYLGLKEGEEIPLRDLLYGTILRSGNDAAIALAEHISGSEAAFVQLMNQTAQQFGMTGTQFANAHGLHNEYHFTTARDLATLAREAMMNDTFAEIVAAKSYAIDKTNLQRARTINTGHRIMQETRSGEPNSYYYPYANGIKSGTTDAAGHCFVGSAEKDGVQLISVVLQAADQYAVYRDTKRLLEYGFSQYTHVTLTEMYLENPLKVYTTGYDKSDIGLGELELSASPLDPTKTVEISGTYDEIEQMTANLRNMVLVQYTRELKAPISAGEVIGRMTYVTETGEAVEYNLLATRSVVARKDGPPSLSDIIAMTDADPNPFPPLTVEIVLIVLSPLLIVLAVILMIRLLVRSYKRHYARLPKNQNRYVK